MRRHLPHALAGGVLILAACGAGTSDDPNLSAQANDGRDVIRSNGCAACHGSSGQGGVGPTFVGLYNSEVELIEGGPVVADRSYLAESITDPGAKKRAGFNVPMPTNSLSETEIDSVVAYIQELTAGQP